MFVWLLQWENLQGATADWHCRMQLVTQPPWVTCGQDLDEGINCIWKSNINVKYKHWSFLVPVLVKWINISNLYLYLVWNCPWLSEISYVLIFSSFICLNICCCSSLTLITDPFHVLKNKTCIKPLLLIQSVLFCSFLWYF